MCLYINEIIENNSCISYFLLFLCAIIAFRHYLYDFKIFSYCFGISHSILNFGHVDDF